MTSPTRPGLPTRYEDFEHREAELPWLDRTDAEESISRRLESGDVTALQATKLREWCAQGWITLDTTLDLDLVDRVNADIQAKLDAHAGEAMESWNIELQNTFHESEAVLHAATYAGVLQWCDLVLGRKSVLFQTLDMPFGSEIPPHVDQILMSTHPAGNMLAALVALEDVTLDAGPLMLWTGSHRLAYLSATEVGLPRDGDEPARGQSYDENYYARNRERIAELELQPYLHLPKKGEVLLWHSNILHGGAPIERSGSTRKSLVAHYFAGDVWHYSDLFNRTCVLPLITV